MAFWCVNRHTRESHIQRSFRTHCGTERQLGGAAAGPARSSRSKSTLLTVPSLLDEKELHDEKEFLQQMRAGPLDRRFSLFVGLRCMLFHNFGDLSGGGGGEPHTCPTLSGSGRCRERIRRTEEPMGLGGFTTQDLKRTQVTARMTALVYNWWSLFVRLIEPMIGREAITRRPLLLTGVARASKHAGSTTLFLNSSHAQTQKIRKKLADLTQFLRKLQSAPQLTSIERWCRILGGTGGEKFPIGKNYTIWESLPAG